MNEPMWKPSPERIAQANVTAFMHAVQKQHGAAVRDYDALWRWSIGQPEAFWSAVWSFSRVIGDAGKRVVVDGERMPGAKWFPDARLNFAENLLRRRDDTPALVFRGEDRVQSRVTFAELYAE